MRISVIIPCGTQNPYLIESLSALSKLDYDNYEVIVVSDEEIDLEFPNTRILVTGKLLPSQKRNIGVQFASGEIVAFLDDDAFPEKDWLAVSSQILTETLAACRRGISLYIGLFLKLRPTYSRYLPEIFD